MYGDFFVCYFFSRVSQGVYFNYYTNVLSTDHMLLKGKHSNINCVRIILLRKLENKFENRVKRRTRRVRQITLYPSNGYTDPILPGETENSGSNPGGGGGGGGGSFLIRRTRNCTVHAVCFTPIRRCTHTRSRPNANTSCMCVCECVRVCVCVCVTCV